MLNYTPSYLNETEAPRLTARKKLVHVRKVLESVREIKCYWPMAKWDDLITDLERQEKTLEEDVSLSIEALTKEYLRDPRFTFENIDNGLTVRCVVYQPDNNIDMPYIDNSSYEWMKRVLRGSNIEVHADCDVYVVSHKTYIQNIIHRYE